MNFARPIKNESTDGFRSNTSAMKSVGREEEEKKKKKKRSIAEHRRASDARESAKWQNVKENDTRWTIYLRFYGRFTEALAEPLLRASAASHHIQHERVASTGPLVIALGVAYVPETEREKRTSLKSVLRPGETISGIVKIYLWIVGKELMINDGQVASNCVSLKIER